MTLLQFVPCGTKFRQVDPASQSAVWVLSEVLHPLWGQPLNEAIVRTAEGSIRYIALGFRDGNRCMVARGRLPGVDTAEWIGVEAPTGRAETKAGPSYPANLPAEFWESRSLFREMRNVAAYHRVSPDALLGNYLGRAAAMLPPGTLMFSSPIPSGLDLLVAIVGEPGESKTKAGKLGRMSMPKPDTEKCPLHLVDLIDGIGISSGPGIIESFMGCVEKGERVQTATNGLFYCDEGSVLKQINSRNGEILDEVLRCIFSGTPLSTPNATKDRWRHVEGYCIGVVINMTPKAVGPLLAQSGDGSPQRFLWFSAADPNMPRFAEKCEPPRIELPEEPVEIQFDPSIVADLDHRLWLRQTGQLKVDPLDVHLGWVQAKVAAILTLWDGRRSVERHDWALAGTIIDVSCSTRRHVAALSAAIEQESHVKQGRAAGVRQAAAEEARVEAEETKAVDNMRRGALQAARVVWNEGPQTEGKLKNKLRSNLRALWTEASRFAQKEGWLKRSASGGTITFSKGPVEPPPRS